MRISQRIFNNFGWQIQGIAYITHIDGIQCSQVRNKRRVNPFLALAFILAALTAAVNASDDFLTVDSAKSYLRRLPVAEVTIPKCIDNKDIGFPFYQRLVDGFYNTIRQSIFDQEMSSYDHCLQRDGWSFYTRKDYQKLILRMIERRSDSINYDAQIMAKSCLPKIRKALNRIAGKK